MALQVPITVFFDQPDAGLQVIVSRPGSRAFSGSSSVLLESLRLATHESLLFEASLPHCWRNPGTGPSVFLLIFQTDEPGKPVEQHLHPGADHNTEMPEAPFTTGVASRDSHQCRSFFAKRFAG